MRLSFVPLWIRIKICGVRGQTVSEISQIHMVHRRWNKS